MLKISQLIKFIEENNPQATPVRLSFFNFLKGQLDHLALVNPELIELYFNYAMDYQHWIDNKKQLSHEIQLLLTKYNSNYSQSVPLEFIKFPDDSQIIEILNQSDAEDIIRKYLLKFISKESKIKILSDQGKKIIAFILAPDQSIEVHFYDRKFKIKEGDFEPLRNDLRLYYTSDLLLKENTLQKIEVAPYITAQFNVIKGKCTGNLLRGYVFQKLQDFKAEPIESIIRLYNPLKKVEQYFVSRSSDHYYQELLQQIERTQNLAEQGDREAIQWSTAIIAKAESALENIYINDKVLTLMVRDLKLTTESFKLKNNKEILL